MEYRKHIDSTEELGRWYDDKYTEMGDGWTTPLEECNKHLDDLGVPYDGKLWLLDIGCGAGHFLLEAEKRVSCVGFEISRVGLDLCKSRITKAVVFEETIEKLSGEYAPFDFITAIGSLEHVVDLDKALDNIRELLKPTGKFYFYVPNEKWVHMDQPNERTMKDEEWDTLFFDHGLYSHSSNRWNDSTAFIGGKEKLVLAFNKGTEALIEYWDDKITKAKKTLDRVGTKLNVGSGQRPFDREYGWINVDINPKWNPDVVTDWNNLTMFSNGSIDLVVSHHSLEHVGCNEGDGFVREAYRVLRPGGSLIVCVPDSRALAQRFSLQQIDEYTFNVNMYGAYMGDEADRHKWSYSRQGLWEYLKKAAPWKDVHSFNWRQIAGADIAQDWWIQAQEAIK